MVNKKTMSVAVDAIGAGSSGRYLETGLKEIKNRVPYKTYTQEKNNEDTISKGGNLKGMMKLGLGIIYFTSLVFFLTKLLT